MNIADIETLSWSWSVPLIVIVVLLCWLGMIGQKIIGYLERQEQRDQHFYGEWAAERLLQKADAHDQAI